MTVAAILDHLDIIAVVNAGLFAGTALYVTVGETPAMKQLGLDEHWRFFPYMYKRAALSQAIFAAAAGVTGILHGTRIIGSTFHRNLWIIAGSAFVAIGPYTFIFMLPTNNTIINDNNDVKLGKESRISITKRKELLDKWSVLHLGRTLGSLVGFTAMVFGLSHHSSLILGW